MGLRTWVLKGRLTDQAGPAWWLQRWGRRAQAMAWPMMLAVLGSAVATAALAGDAVRPVSALVGNVEAGRAEFARCQWCHQAGPSARSGFGPQLTGIVGRRAASAKDFAYSPAMKNANIVWTEAMLAAFLKAPKTVVPDNKMRFWGISDAQRIANLLAYLRTF